MSKVLIFEKIYFFDFFFNIFSFDKKIYYTDLSKFLKILIKLNFINIIFKNKFKKIDFDSINRLDEEGLPIRYHLEKTVFEITNKIPVYDFVIDAEYQKQEPFFQKLIQLWFLKRFREKTILFYLIKEFIKKKYSKNEVYLYFNSIPSFCLWRNYLTQKYGFKIYEKKIFFSKNTIIAKILYILFYILKNFFISKKISNISKLNKKIKIAEQFEYTIFDSKNNNYNSMYWKERSGFDNDQIILFFNRADTKLNNYSKSIIENNKYLWIDTKSKVFPKFNITSILKKFYSVKINKNFENRLSMLLIIYINIINVEFFRSIIKFYNIKFIHHREEVFPEIGFACKLENSIFFMNHWSYDHFPIAHFNFNFCDIFFSSGKYNTDYLKKNNYNCEYLFETGTVGSNIKTNNYKYNEIVKIEKNKNNFDISVFDSSFTKLNIFQTKEMLKKFYYELFDFIDENNGYNLFIKSKGITLSKLRKDKNFENRLNSLINKKQIFIFSSKIPPIYVAKISDLSISFNINTAGFYSLINKIPSIFYDFSNNIHHPINKFENLKKCIIYDLSNFKNKIKEISELNIVNDNFKNYLESFDDNNGYIRCSILINRLKNLFENNYSKNTSLEIIKKEYIMNYGKNNFVNLSNHSNNKNNYWSN